MGTETTPPGVPLTLPADEFELVQALTHAMAALADDNEGVRLWMLDCGMLVAKHRARAEAAEARLATIASHCRGHLKLPGSCCPHLAHEILAIISTERERDGDV